jgi:hypothetical protein
MNWKGFGRKRQWLNQEISQNLPGDCADINDNLIEIQTETSRKQI